MQHFYVSATAQSGEIPTPEEQSSPRPVPNVCLNKLFGVWDPGTEHERQHLHPAGNGGASQLPDGKPPLGAFKESKEKKGSLSISI